MRAEVYRFARRDELAHVELDMDEPENVPYALNRDAPDDLIALDPEGSEGADEDPETELPDALIERKNLDAWRAEVRGYTSLDGSQGASLRVLPRPANGMYGEAFVDNLGRQLSRRALLVGPERGGPVYVLAATRDWSTTAEQEPLAYALLHALDDGGLWDDPASASALAASLVGLLDSDVVPASYAPFLEAFARAHRGDDRVTDAVVLAGALLDRAMAEGKFPRPLAAATRRSAPR